MGLGSFILDLPLLFLAPLVVVFCLIGVVLLLCVGIMAYLLLSKVLAYVAGIDIDNNRGI